MHTVETNSHPLFYSMCKMNTIKAYLKRLQGITPTNEKNYKTEMKSLFLMVSYFKMLTINALTGSKECIQLAHIHHFLFERIHHNFIFRILF